MVLVGVVVLDVLCWYWLVCGWVLLVCLVDVWFYVVGVDVVDELNDWLCDVGFEILKEE